MKILIICVNYNSDSSLKSYIDSIVKAWSPKYDIELDIVDNSEQSTTLDIRSYKNIHINIVDNVNNGYFGGVSVSYNKRIKDKFDYIIISNVDMVIKSDFFEVLERLKFDSEVGWIAPAIISQVEGRDKNPKMIDRPSRKKLQILKLMYTFPFLYRLYLSTLYKRKKIVNNKNVDYIYGGHGSFIILTKSFIQNYNKLNYPIFLFGEEQYLAELCRNRGLKVKYVPILKVIDREHASTSKFPSKKYCKYNQLAQKYILKKYYE